ncbi:50S ribosomal protein L32 [Bienertia sinuspersici]
MAFRVGMQRGLQAKVDGCLYTVRRLTHAFALPPSFGNSIDPISSPPFTLPEDDTDFSSGFPGFAPGGGSFDLMAVPKKKVSRHKRGIRNGPKALKPTPVIVRCKCCGRVKLPHFYCCSGRREDPGERSDATN